MIDFFRFGAPHDGVESGTIPGGPCSWDDGYIMSYTKGRMNKMHWSKCSITAMQNYLK